MQYTLHVYLVFAGSILYFAFKMYDMFIQASPVFTQARPVFTQACLVD